MKYILPQIDNIPSGLTNGGRDAAHQPHGITSLAIYRIESLTSHSLPPERGRISLFSRGNGWLAGREEKKYNGFAQVRWGDDFPQRNRGKK